MTDAKLRAALVREAESWVGTPYHANGAVKGAGVNCAQFIYCVARDAGALAADAPPPRWFTPQMATHSKEERLVAYIKAYGGVEISEAEAQAGDFVIYRSGRSHGHMALLLDPPGIIHVTPLNGCQKGLVHEGSLGAFARKYFTLEKGIE